MDTYYDYDDYDYPFDYNDINVINETHIQVPYNKTHSVTLIYPYNNMSESNFTYDYPECIPHDFRGNSTDSLPEQAFFDTFLPIICIIGIVGIILTIIVLSRKNMSTSTNAYLSFLAVADLGFLIFLSTMLISQWSFTLRQYYMYLIYLEYAHIFVQTSLLASVWLTVMLAIERYIAICFPLRAISICTTRRARIIICVIFLLSFLCRVPNFFEHKIVQAPMCGRPIYIMKLTQLGLDITYKRIYTWIIDNVITVILPFILLLYFNVRLIMEIHKSTKYLRYHIGVDSNMQTMVSSEQIKITFMLVGIIIVFFVCQAPYMITVAYRNLGTYNQHEAEYASRQEMANTIIKVTIILLAVKSAFNFIIYCWFSEKFWNTFKRVFCHRNCFSKHKLQIKNHTNTVHSADQNGGNSIRKPSYLTKDTVC